MHVHGNVLIGDGSSVSELKFKTPSGSPTGRLWVAAVPNGGILTGIPEGAMFLLRMGNPTQSSLWFFAAGGSTNGCHHCERMLGDSGMFQKNKNCGASRACIFYAGPGQGMGVQAKSGTSFLAYVFY